MSYDLYLDGVLYPVTPGKVQIKLGNQNKTINLINEGEVNVIKTPGLQEISFELLLPNSKYPFARYPNGYQNAGYYLKLLRALKDEGKRFQFILSRAGNTNLYNTNITVTLETVTETEDAKEGTDVKVSIKLKQWKNYGTKVIKLTEVKGGITAAVETTRQASDNQPATGITYTVVSGDTLWGIAKYFYGNGSLYTKIVAANSDIISNPNLIYPGMKLFIPDTDAPIPVKTTAKKVDKSSGGSKNNPPYAILNSSYGIVNSNIQSWNAAYGYYQANGGGGKGWKIVDSDNFIVM